MAPVAGVGDATLRSEESVAPATSTSRNTLAASPNQMVCPLLVAL